MAAFYFYSGINHFIKPEKYLAIMPPWLPFGKELVFISGVVEVILSCLLLPKATRRFAAWGIIVLLIAVFPANIQMSVNYYRDNHPLFWVTLIRLPLQLLLIWWAFSFTHVPYQSKKAEKMVF